MPDPITYASTTPRLGIPLLFSGQVQKEFYINEGHALIDALLHAACEGEAVSPPATPADGETWIVANGADGSWTGEDGKLANWQSGTWLFIAPSDGMRIYDRSTGQLLLHSGGWQRPAAPADPSGGTTVDSEARAAISGLISALIAGGLLTGN